MMRFLLLFVLYFPIGQAPSIPEYKSENSNSPTLIDCGSADKYRKSNTWWGGRFLKKTSDIIFGEEHCILEHSAEKQASATRDVSSSSNDEKFSCSQCCGKVVGTGKSFVIGTTLGCYYSVKGALTFVKYLVGGICGSIKVALQQRNWDKDEKQKQTSKQSDSKA